MTPDPLKAYLSEVRKEVQRRIRSAIKAGRIPDFRAEYERMTEGPLPDDPAAIAALAYLAQQHAAPSTPDEV